MFGKNNIFESEVWPVAAVEDSQDFAWSNLGQFHEVVDYWESQNLVQLSEAIPTNFGLGYHESSTTFWRNFSIGIDQSKLTTTTTQLWHELDKFIVNLVHQTALISNSFPVASPSLPKTTSREIHSMC